MPAMLVNANQEKLVHQSPLRDRTFHSFRFMHGVIARATKSVCSHETYFDHALGWLTDRIKSIQLPVKDTRFVQSGKSAYTLHK